MIDNSSAWRMDRDVPLVVPEVNADALHDIKKGIIANPNCSTAQLVVALKPLHDLANIKRVVVSTYQSVSGAGKEAMDELFRQTRAVFVADPVEVEKFTKQIAFNVIPHIDVFLDSGFTKEEWKMMVETQKILDPDIQVIATCVRVPVFIGHSEAVNIEFEKPITAEKARAALRAAPGILVVDKREDGGYATPHGMRRRGRHLCQPHPQGPHGGERPVAVDRVRQSAQGRGAERRADRRMPGQSQTAEGRLMPKGLLDRAHRCARSRRPTRNMSRPAGPPIERYGAKFLARGGKTEVLEGPARARNVVIEFASMEDALACYNSPEYTAARKIRQGRERRRIRPGRRR